MHAKKASHRFDVATLRATTGLIVGSSFVGPSNVICGVTRGVEKRVVETELAEFGVAEKLSSGGAWDQGLALIRRKSGRIAGEAMLRVNGAAEDREPQRGAGFTRAQVVDS